MKYPVQVWRITDLEKGLDTLKHVVEFGTAIAWIDSRFWNGKEFFEVGLILPFTEADKTSMITYRAFMRHLFLISQANDWEGVTSYTTPISPLVPGNGGEMSLQDCLVVPSNFSHYNSNE